MPASPLREGIDYTLLPDGRLVLTAHFLSQRGYCCGSGCLHCPYDYERVPEPKRSQLLALRTEHEKPAADPEGGLL